jgi:hypothetical protein
MFRPSRHRTPKRRGVILLVVLSLLTLFALVGLTFLLYANALADSARLSREAEHRGRVDLEPELLLAYFLGQLLYDTKDDETGVLSALRGHSLARLMYGYDQREDNRTPFNGSGRLHTGPGTYANPFQIDDFSLINYTYFPADGFLRDPERLGSRVDPSQPRGPFTGGFNAPYTYNDLNNMFLGAVRADGTVLLPSFHRPWTGFGSLAPDNPNWYDKDKPWLKYQVLRPRPADMGPGFRAPEDAGGDIKNLIGAPGGHDSIWLDLGFPVLTAQDGRKFKPLFAPLVVDLDGRVNVNVHGNIRGPGRTHVSNQGWGPWEVNLGHILTVGDEWSNLCAGSASPAVLGRYGGSPWAGKPGTPGLPGGRAPAIGLPHFYAQVDYDACQELAGFAPSAGLRLPGSYAQSYRCFPLFPAGYGNGSPDERAEHPLLYNVFRPAGDDRRFAIASLEALLRHGDTGSEALTSELTRLCPRNFADPRTRRLVTTHSFDRDQPGISPWVYHYPYEPSQPYQVHAANPNQCPAGSPIPFPPLALRLLGAENGEFGVDWRAADSDLVRVDLNRRLTPYPLPSPQTPETFNGRFDVAGVGDQFLQAQHDRQKLADDIYRRLLSVTGVSPPARPATPTDADLLPRRWLAQLAVNIVDFLDEDDVSTPFNFYTAVDAGTREFDSGALNNRGAELPRYWVFGVELPHVLLNEILAEYQEPAKPVQGATYLTKVWVELHNPFLTPAPGTSLQPQDGFPVRLKVEALQPGQSVVGKPEAYAPYQIVLANRLRDRPGNDNVLGVPDQVRAQTDVADFAAPAETVGGPAQPAPSIAPGGFLLLGPPGKDAHDAIAASPRGDVPTATPWLRSGSMQYTVTFATESTRNPDDRATGLTVLLRRLANPHLPFDPRATVPGSFGPVQPNPWYNPYLTVDYLDQVPLRNATDPAARYASRGKLQPYAADFSQVRDQVAEDPRQPTQHTFGRRNVTPSAAGHYDWLVHLDRPLISPMELLAVAGCQPHQLTQRFVTEAGPFNHRAPWFDQTRRLYRVLEFLETGSRAAGASVGGRIPGRVNLNTIWDPETFRALCDPQPANNFTVAEVNAIFERMLQLRTPAGAPGPGDRPFLSLATGFSRKDSPDNPDPQHPFRDRGINDTFLRSGDPGADALAGGGPQTPRLFQVSGPHPYLQDQLLTKLFNNVTTRSNVFAVWVTVGFFEVTDDTARPVKLGSEIGRSEGRHVRHRMFAIVDRSNLRSNQGPPEMFDPRANPGQVPYFNIID